MKHARPFRTPAARVGLLIAALAVAGIAAPAGATTLIRQSLEELVRTNGAVVVGEVVDASSYWNAEGTFILTDVRFMAHQVLKGSLEPSEVTVTLMGGAVGDLTTLIIGGAELVPGRFYVLFLNDENLPGVERATTVRDHVQGAYDVEMTRRGLRAVSQANRHPLLPDAFGYVDAPGGLEGFPLDAMMQSIRDIAKVPQAFGQEVQ